MTAKRHPCPHGNINVERVHAFVQAVRQQPGRRAGYYGRTVGLTDRHTIADILIHCETLGILLSEDERGRLMHIGSS